MFHSPAVTVLGRTSFNRYVLVKVEAIVYENIQVPKRRSVCVWLKGFDVALTEKSSALLVPPLVTTVTLRLPAVAVASMVNVAASEVVPLTWAEPAEIPV